MCLWRNRKLLYFLHLFSKYFTRTFVSFRHWKTAVWRRASKIPIYFQYRYSVFVGIEISIPVLIPVSQNRQFCVILPSKRYLYQKLRELNLFPVWENTRQFFYFTNSSWKRNLVLHELISQIPSFDKYFVKTSWALLGK